MLQSYADDEEKEGWSFKTYDFAFSLGRFHVYTQSNLISMSLAMSKSHNANEFVRRV